MTLKPTDDNRKFTELYNVQRLSSSYIANDSQVCISTIQRLYSILKGEELDESAELDNPNESTWIQKQLNKNRLFLWNIRQEFLLNNRLYCSGRMPLFHL